MMKDESTSQRRGWKSRLLGETKASPIFPRVLRSETFIDPQLTGTANLRHSPHEWWNGRFIGIVYN